MAKSHLAWLIAALAACGVGAALSVWLYTPSLGVKAQLQIDKWCEALAAHAATKNGGVFPEDTDGCRAALELQAESDFHDPWGRPYRYEREQPKGPFRLWSTGADGRDDRGAGDDIASWTR